MFREIVGERTRADAFIPCHPEIVVRDRAVAEVDIGARIVHPDAAEAGAVELDSPIALPGGRMPILSTNREVDCGWTLPFPFAQKLTHLDGPQCAEHARIDSAVDVKTKIVRPVEEIRVELAALTADTNVVEQSPRAIPGKIRAQVRERDRAVSEVSNCDVSDDF